MQNLGTIANTFTVLEQKVKDAMYKVYSARHNQTQVLHLIEVYKNPLPANLMNIMNNLIALNHPYVIHVISQGNGLIVLNNRPQVNRPYIVYENVTHSYLSDYIHIQRFTERQSKLIFKKILEGVRALHNANICHRDLNPENILLDENYNPKITDFYISCMNMNNLQGHAGTKSYTAPEVLANQPYDGILADIFSLGQLLFILVTGQFGFKSSTPNDHFYGLIMAQNLNHYWQLIANHNLSQEFKDLFIRMVNPNPAQRPTINQILNDAWMQEINNLNPQQMDALENEVRNEFQLREQRIQQELQILQNNIDNLSDGDNTK